MIARIIESSEVFKLLNFLNDSTDEQIVDFFFDDSFSTIQKKHFVEQISKLSFNKIPVIGSFLEDINKHISFDSNLITEDFLPFGYPRLLSTDNVLVIPSETPIRFLISSNDVIHS